MEEPTSNRSKRAITTFILETLDALLRLDEETVKLWIRETWPKGKGLYW